MGRMGSGLRATKRFEKGEFVIEYSGEHIESEQKAKERSEALKKTGRDVYLMQFQVEDGKYKWSVIIPPNLSRKLLIHFIQFYTLFHFIFFTSFIHLRVDASSTWSGKGRYINHLRKGWNLKPLIVHVDGIPRVAFLANETINIGDDLYYDYGERDRSIIKENPWLMDFKQKGMG